MIQLEASTGIALADVIFEVNGVALPPVVGQPFQIDIKVPLMIEATKLVINAIGRDANSSELASDQVMVSIIPALYIQSPSILGVPLGGSSNLELALSGPLLSDLPIQLKAIQPNVLDIPGELNIPAGNAKLTVPVTGLTKGGTVLIVESEHGGGAIVASVGILESGFEVRQTAQSTGFSLSPIPLIGKIGIAPNVVATMVTQILNKPALIETEVTAYSTNPAVVDVPNSLTIPMGSQVISLTLTAGVQGEADLILVMDKAIYKLKVIVGSSVGSDFSIASQPISFSVSPSSFATPLIIDPFNQVTVKIPLLTVPATEDITILATSRDPSIVDLSTSLTVIPLGSTFVELTIIANTEINSETMIDIEFGSERRSLRVIVGLPDPKDIPLIISPTLGVEIQ